MFSFIQLSTEKYMMILKEILYPCTFLCAELHSSLLNEDEQTGGCCNPNQEINLG